MVSRQIWGFAQSGTLSFRIMVTIVARKSLRPRGEKERLVALGSVLRRVFVMR